MFGMIFVGLVNVDIISSTGYLQWADMLITTNRKYYEQIINVSRGKIDRVGNHTRQAHTHTVIKTIPTNLTDKRYNASSSNCITSLISFHFINIPIGLLFMCAVCTLLIRLFCNGCHAFMKIMHTIYLSIVWMFPCPFGFPICVPFQWHETHTHTYIHARFNFCGRRCDSRINAKHN